MSRPGWVVRFGRTTHGGDIPARDGMPLKVKAGGLVGVCHPDLTDADAKRIEALLNSYEFRAFIGHSDSAAP